MSCRLEDWTLTASPLRVSLPPLPLPLLLLLPPAARAFCEQVLHPGRQLPACAGSLRGWLEAVACLPTVLLWWYCTPVCDAGRVDARMLITTIGGELPEPQVDEGEAPGWAASGASPVLVRPHLLPRWPVPCLWHDLWQLLLFTSCCPPCPSTALCRRAAAADGCAERGGSAGGPAV